MAALSDALDTATAQFSHDTAHSFDLWGGPEQVPPSATLTKLTPCGDVTGLEEIPVQNTLLTPAILAYHGMFPSTQIRACLGTLVTNQHIECDASMKCLTYASYLRTVTVAWQRRADMWTTVDTLSHSYGEHIQCVQTSVPPAHAGNPETAYMPTWSDSTRAEFLANHAHAPVPAQLDLACSGVNQQLVDWRKALFTSLAGQAKTGALRVAHGSQDDGQDAVAALSGAVLLLRATLTMVAPTMVSNDEYARASLFGSERIPQRR